MAKVLISPGKYVQGAGEMKKLGEYAQNYGKKALILIARVIQANWSNGRTKF